MIPSIYSAKKEDLQESTLNASCNSEEDPASKIARLERELGEAILRRDFYDEMINVAESCFKISIRKNWSQTVMDLHAKFPMIYSITNLCRLFGVSKQAYFKYDREKAF